MLAWACVTHAPDSLMTYIYIYIFITDSSHEYKRADPCSCCTSANIWLSKPRPLNLIKSDPPLEYFGHNETKAGPHEVKAEQSKEKPTMQRQTKNIPTDYLGIASGRFPNGDHTCTLASPAAEVQRIPLSQRQHCTGNLPPAPVV